MSTEKKNIFVVDDDKSIRWILDKALKKAGLSIRDIDCVELNEAFAAQACAVSLALKLNNKKVNPNGGAIALGHPVGATGTILCIKLIHELRRTNSRFGLLTMCIGGGQGIAIGIENLQLS